MKFFTNAITKIAKANITTFVEKTVCGRPVPSVNKKGLIWTSPNSTPIWYENVRDETSRTEAIKMSEEITKKGGQPKIIITVSMEDKSTWRKAYEIYTYKWSAIDVRAEKMEEVSPFTPRA